MTDLITQLKNRLNEIRCPNPFTDIDVLFSDTSNLVKDAVCLTAQDGYCLIVIHRPGDIYVLAFPPHQLTLPSSTPPTDLT